MRNEASNRVVCGSRQVSMHEMWKRKQIYEDAREMGRTKIHVKKFGKMERRHLGGHDLARRMDKQDVVQKVFWIRT